MPRMKTIGTTMKTMGTTLLVIAALLFALPALAGQPEDAWITTKVKMKLIAANDLDPLEINVDTIDGVVTLHGHVASSELKRQAREEASQVKGVRDVRNLLAVTPEATRKLTRASDEELRGRIETALKRDQALASSDIEIASINGGIVVLSGRADSLSAHRRALEDVRAVEGVRSVASEIKSPDELADQEIWSDEVPGKEMASSGASDTWITSKVKVRLMAEPGLSPFAINVDTRNGVVTLFGAVGSEQTRLAAEREVKKVAGVKEVENELQVVPDVAAKRVDAQDDQLVETVEMRLEAREALRDAHIDVEVTNGVVRLTGTTASFPDKLTALTVARSTEGVRSVVDGLRIESGEG